MAPLDHSMHMQMLDLMYALSAWLNLMRMPQFVDMGMGLRQLRRNSAGGHQHAGHEHATGGVGDTPVGAA